jgi:hypothetical protein
MSKHALEKHQAFPYIAWALCIGFAYFVYTLTLDLKEVTAELGAQTSATQLRANQNAADITDFGR